MSGNLIISENFEEDDELTYVSCDIGEHNFTVVINTKVLDDFMTLISKPYDFDEMLDTSISVEEMCENFESKEFLEDFKKKRVEYLKNVEYVSFDMDSKKIADYINENPILKTKKIILKNYNTLDYGLINEIMDLFGNNTAYLYFEIDGNQRIISFDEYKSTVEKVDRFINEIKLFDFSPMEQIMYLYDFVRNKVYCMEGENEDPTISRDFTSSLLGDKIVCVGYSKIFIYLLEKLDIEGIEVRLDSKNGGSGHARVEIYVKDPKYGVDGVYYFDPTWDSKGKDGDNEYLYSYRYFGLTKEEMDKASKYRLIDDRLPINLDKLIDLFEENYDKNGWDNMPKEIVTQINHMNYLIYKKRLVNPIYLLPHMKNKNLPSKEEVIKNIKELSGFFDKKINAETFLQILFNVRKIQYYYDPVTYPFGLEEFFKTTLVSKWDFIQTPEDRLLIEIFGKKEGQRNIANKYVRYMDQTNLRTYIDEIKISVKNESKKR